MNILLNNYDTTEPSKLTEFNYVKNANLITFNFDCHDSALYSFTDKDNDDLWRGCVVEVFLDTGLDFYYEFEAAPNGAVFAAKIRNRKIEYIDPSIIKAKATVVGNGYQIQLIVDLNKLEKGDELKFNAFRVENKKGETVQQLQALNPTLCETFHVREKFIRL